MLNLDLVVSTVAAQLEERSRQHARMTAPPAATGQLARSRPGQPAQSRLDRMAFTTLVLPVLTSGSSLISFAGGISSSKLVNMLNLDLACQHCPGSTLVLPVSTSGGSLISFAGGISSSKLVSMLNLDLVSQHGPG